MVMTMGKNNFNFCEVWIPRRKNLHNTNTKLRIFIVHVPHCKNVNNTGIKRVIFPNNNVNESDRKYNYGVSIY